MSTIIAELRAVHQTSECFNRSPRSQGAFPTLELFSICICYCQEIFSFLTSSLEKIFEVIHFLLASRQGHGV